MGFPKLSTGRVEPQISNILQAYVNPGYIADKILPMVPNLKDENGKIAALGNHHLRVFSSKRSLYDESGHRMSFELTNDDSYQIEYHDLEAYVPDRLQNQLQKPFDAKRDAGLSLREAIMLEREDALATAMASTSTLSNNTTLSGTSQFNDYANSTPEDVFETARTTIQGKIGREANVMAMGRKVFNTLKRHPFFLEMVKGISLLTPSALATLLKDYFEVEEVLVGNAIKISSNEGQAETKTSVWGNHVWFFNRPKAASAVRPPPSGYSFSLEGQLLRASTRRHPQDKGDIVVVDYAYQDKLLDVDAAYLIKDAVA